MFLISPENLPSSLSFSLVFRSTSSLIHNSEAVFTSGVPAIMLATGPAASVVRKGKGVNDRYQDDRYAILPETLPDARQIPQNPVGVVSTFRPQRPPFHTVEKYVSNKLT